MTRRTLLELQALRTFPQLSASAFQHPDDRKATNALRKVPGFSALIRQVSGSVLETATQLQHLSHCVRVGPNQAVEVYRDCVRAQEILSVSELPEVFISPENAVNAYAMGMKKTVILLTRGLIESMTPAERLCVIGHEMGHIKCDHMVNKTVANFIAILGVAGIGRLIPVLGEAVTMTIAAPLYAWSRKAELSCDRAALLTVQDPEIVASTLAKLGGWPSSLGDVDFDSLRQQADEYDELDNDTVAAVFKIINTINSGIFLTHPVPIQRIRSILLWGESEQYGEILGGNYTKGIEAPPQPRCACCGTTMEFDQVFCTVCGKKSQGTELVMGQLTCPKCWRPRAAEDRFCKNCGTNLMEIGESAAAGV